MTVACAATDGGSSLQVEVDADALREFRRGKVDGGATMSTGRVGATGGRLSETEPVKEVWRRAPLAPTENISMHPPGISAVALHSLWSSQVDGYRWDEERALLMLHKAVDAATRLDRPATFL
ncbi:MAG: hypothetical protein ACR2PL_02250 [Dehalococcoidia bacterium]